MSESGKRICGATTKSSKGRCQMPAGWRTSHPGYGTCRLHCGATPNAITHAARLEVEDVVGQFMGTAVDVSPEEGLIACVRLAAGQLAYATQKVAALSEAEQIEHNRAGETRLHVWARVQQESIDRLARVSRMAVESGVSEKYVRAAEHAGEVMAGALSEIFDRLDLTDDQRARAPSIVHEALAALEREPGVAFTEALADPPAAEAA